MANIRVKDLPNTSAPAADTDEFIIDSSSAGTRRLNYGELKTAISGDFQAGTSTYKVATLGSDNKLDPAQIPDTLSQGLNFVGVANSAGDLTSTTQGDFYVIQTAFGVYSVGDQAVYDGSAYVRVVDGTKEIAEGGTGATTLDAAKTNLEIINIGSAANQVSLNSMLGDLAFQSSDGVSAGTISADEIGVGVTDPDELIHAKATSSAVYFKSESGSTVGVFGASNTAGAAVSGSTTASDYQLWSANQLRWTISGSTGNLVANGTAIDFGSGASTTLDDYEEGTWTPAFISGTGSFTTMSMSINNARYTKIGNIVHVRAYFGTSNVDATGASGALRISGLPFTASGHFSSISVGYAINWAAAPIAGYVRSGTNQIGLTQRNTSITGSISESYVTGLTTGAVGSGNVIMIDGAYETNA